MQYNTKIPIKRMIFFMIVLCLCVLVTACNTAEDRSVENKTEESFIDMINEYKGYEREIHQEEYDLYSYFVEREVTENISVQEMEEKVKAYANKVNAIFYLANKLGLCEPYSYEVLEMRKNQENEIRKVKKENGEPVYGLEQFTLEQFFQYRLDTVEAQLRTYLEGVREDWLVKEAKQYYEENKERFRFREKVEYELTEGDKTEILTADRTQLNFMSDSDRALSDFLETGEEQERYEDIGNEGKREVVIRKITYSEDGFVKNQENAILVYVNQKLYKELISKVAENNPVRFRLNIESEKKEGEWK